MESHLLQMRGLKHRTNGIPTINESVASFTDAWIETEHGYKQSQYHHVASFTDAWIETGEQGFSGIRKHSRIFYRCVD